MPGAGHHSLPMRLAELAYDGKRWSFRLAGYPYRKIAHAHGPASEPLIGLAGALCRGTVFQSRPTRSLRTELTRVLSPERLGRSLTGCAS